MHNKEIKMINCDYSFLINSLQYNLLYLWLLSSASWYVNSGVSIRRLFMFLWCIFCQRQQIIRGFCEKVYSP